MEQSRSTLLEKPFRNAVLEDFFFSMQVTLFFTTSAPLIVVEQIFDLKNLISSIFYEEMLVISFALCGLV